MMWSLARSVSVLCLGALPTLVASCTGSGAGITTASIDPAIAASPVSETSQLTRSVEVATTAACANVYGYSFEPPRLRETYLDYERKQGASREQLRAIEQSYDVAYQQIIGSRSPSCRGKDAVTVRADLQRYAAGFFTPRTPPPKEVFDVNTLWATQD